MLRIAYCGYDYYANCLALLLARDDVQVLKIYTCGEGESRRFSSEIVRMAKEHKIPYQFKPIDQKEVERLFDKQSCDYVLSAGYSYKIPIGNHRGLNIHPTLLPIGRGAWPFPKIILDGYKESGVTLHKLTDKFDAGDIVLQRAFRLDEQETQDTLHCKNQMLGPRIIEEWLKNPEELWDAARPQGEGEYWKKQGIKERTLDFSKKKDEITALIRAYGSSGVYLSANGKLWGSSCISFQEEKHSCFPGEVVYENNSLLVVAIEEGFLYITGKQIHKRSLVAKVFSKLICVFRSTF